MLDHKTIFITGTDTGVGKSVFTAYLALLFLNQGKKVAISKPIQTGTEKDTDFLTKLTGNKIPIFNTYSFSLPAAPSLSAEAENKKIEIEKIISDVRKLEKEFDHVIVEGIGGIAVPITDSVIARSAATKQSNAKHCPEQSEGSPGEFERRSLVEDSGRHFVSDCFVGTCMPPRNDVYLVADLIKDLNYPVIIIARPTLGTINHTVLTIEYAKQKGLNILGFVISRYDDEETNDPVVKTVPEIISHISGVACLIKLPLIKKLDYDSLVTRVESLSSMTPNCLAKL